MEKTIEYSGKKLFYRITGKGSPLVLLHGLAEDGTIWDELAATLEENNLVIIPDLPGSGGSEPAEEASIEGMAQAVKAVLDAEQLTKVVMIGHSMGGYVSLAFAELFPDSLLALGLYHSSAFADDEEKIATRKKNIDFIARHGTLAYLKQATPTLFSNRTKEEHPEKVDALIEKYKDFAPASLIAYQQAMINRPERLKILESIVKPVLMIIGREDKAIPYELSMRQSHLPSIAYILELENSGHMGMLEEPEQSTTFIKKFLEDLPEFNATILP